jgi:hypothetical protein
LGSIGEDTRGQRSAAHAVRTVLTSAQLRTAHLNMRSCELRRRREVGDAHTQLRPASRTRAHARTRACETHLERLLRTHSREHSLTHSQVDVRLPTRNATLAKLISPALIERCAHAHSSSDIACAVQPTGASGHACGSTVRHMATFHVVCDLPRADASYCMTAARPQCLLHVALPRVPYHGADRVVRLPPRRAPRPPGAFRSVPVGPRGQPVTHPPARSLNGSTVAAGTTHGCPPTTCTPSAGLSPICSTCASARRCGPVDRVGFPQWSV